MCEFVDTEDQLFSSESIDEAIDPTLMPLVIPLGFGVAERGLIR